MSEQQIYFLGKGTSTDVIRQATDKPIRIKTDQHSKLVLLINTETGDVFAHNFNYDMENYTKEFTSTSRATSKLKEDIFFLDPGKKIYFVFQSNYEYSYIEKPDIADYIKYLEDKNVAAGTVIESDISKAGLPYETPVFGELVKLGIPTYKTINVGFELDLKAPENIKAWYEYRGIPYKTDSIPQNIMGPVNNKESIMPEPTKILREYENQASIYRKILDGNLPALREEIKLKKINLKGFFEINNGVKAFITDGANNRQFFGDNTGKGLINPNRIEDEAANLLRNAVIKSAGLYLRSISEMPSQEIRDYTSQNINNILGTLKHLKNDEKIPADTIINLSIVLADKFANHLEKLLLDKDKTFLDMMLRSAGKKDMIKTDIPHRDKIPEHMQRFGNNLLNFVVGICKKEKGRLQNTESLGKIEASFNNLIDLLTYGRSKTAFTDKFSSNKFLRF